MLANCLHDLTAIGPGNLPAVLAALFSPVSPAG
jgi:hypothetical protein